MSIFCRDDKVVVTITDWKFEAIVVQNVEKSGFPNEVIVECLNKKEFRTNTQEMLEVIENNSLSSQQIIKIFGFIPVATELYKEYELTWGKCYMWVQEQNVKLDSKSFDEVINNIKKEIGL